MFRVAAFVLIGSQEPSICSVQGHLVMLGHSCYEKLSSSKKMPKMPRSIPLPQCHQPGTHCVSSLGPLSFNTLSPLVLLIPSLFPNLVADRVPIQPLCVPQPGHSVHVGHLVHVVVTIQNKEGEAHRDENPSPASLLKLWSKLTFLGFPKAVCVNDTTCYPQWSQKNPGIQSYSICRNKSLTQSGIRCSLGSFFWNDPIILYSIHTMKLRIKLLNSRVVF